MSTSKPKVSRISGLSCLVILFTVLAVGANAFYTVSSNKSSSQHLPKVASAVKPSIATKTIDGGQSLSTKINEEMFSTNTFLPAFMPQAAQPPAVAIYDSTCTNLKDTFVLGETVCAKVTGAPVGSPAQRSVTWSGPASNVFDRTDLVTSANVTFTLPINAVSIVDGEPVDNRGTWTVKLVPVGRSVVRANTTFTVTDPTHKAVDAGVYNTNATPGSDLFAGSDATFKLYVVNYGPDDAQDVVVTETVPVNATFVSESQDAGPTFTCTDPASGGGGLTTCTIASLPAGGKAVFTFVYEVGSVSKGTQITSTATVASATDELHTADNDSTATATVTGTGAVTTCNLTCPPDIVTSANTTNQNGDPGAIVTFASAEVSGSCGAVTSSPASGSFFPVGSTTVTVTSAEGGGSCSFTVTVLGGQGPTIDCPDDIAVTAADGECAATVANLGTPTTTGDGVEVSAARSDGQPLDAPYQGGETIITWTATDDNGRRASCTQKVTVAVTDTTPPTITAPPDVNIATPVGASGSCGLVIGETELGTPEASDNCSVTVIRTGVPAGNFYAVGSTTTITYVAKDGAGNMSQPVYQTVTVTDGTPPLIAAPPDASYVCPSEVPAADPSQATRGDVFDSNGHLLPPAPPSDNCSAVTVTVSESSSGAGSASSPLIITRTFTATDAANNSASSTQTITVIDNVPPSLSLNGASSATVECHTSFTDPGATSSDNCAGIAPVTVSGSVDVNTPGTYTLTYTATDAAGNTAGPVTRTVTVVDTLAPSLTLNGASPMTVECHTSFSDPGATASDACAGNLTSSIVVTGSVNPDVVGTYSLTYTVNDGQGHTATATRTVNVVDTTAPTITLNGANPMTVECHTSFSDPGATANDGCAGSVAVTASGSVNVNVPGTYTITYSAHDPSNNTATRTRTVNVVDTTPPTITLKNVTIKFWPPNHKYQTVNVTDLVQSASDGCDGSVSINNVFISKVTSDEAENDDGDGNTTNDIVIGSNCKSVQLRSERSGGGDGRVYTITFKVRDAAGNVTTATAKVSVPHNNGGTAVDSGAKYTVTSSCQ